MILIEWVYLGFGLIVIALAIYANKQSGQNAARLAAAVFIGALIFLPAAAYRGVKPDIVVPPWIIGFLIPVPYLWANKAWIAPLAAMVVGISANPEKLRQFRPGLVDLPLALFCLMPVLQRLAGIEDLAPPMWQTIMLLGGCWALPWFLGRMFFADRAGRLILIDMLIGFSLLLLPIAWFEGWTVIRLHDVLYGPHPFSHDGVDRYFGYRPMAFFEHGNQYGLWMCCAAVAAWWRARFTSTGPVAGLRWLIAAFLIGAALVAQSISAIALMIFALAWLEFAPWLERHSWLYKLTFVGGAVTGILLLIGLVQPESVGFSSPWIERLAEYLRGVGRGSLQWRVGRFLDNLQDVRNHVIIGRGQWSWYHIFRPWDMTSMLIGNFGLIGLGLVAMMIGTAVHRRKGTMPAPTGSTRYLCLALIGMTVGDALLNTFVFLPALAFMGAVCPPLRRSGPSGGQSQANHLGLAPAGLAEAGAGGAKPV